MQISANTELDPEPTIGLKNTKPGDVFRFAEDSFEDALKSELFHYRTATPLKDESVEILCLGDGLLKRRDGDRRVIVHRSRIIITR